MALDLSTTKPDFDSLVAELEINLKNRDSWKDLYLEATGETLIHFNAAIGAMSQWAIEKAFKEAFIGTATLDSSIYAGTRGLGVRITRKTPGVQLCTLQRINKVNMPIRTSLTVPAYSQLYINSSIPFFNRSVLNFSGTIDTLFEVMLHQGQVMSKTYLSDGSPFQQFILPSLGTMSISDVDIYVTVNGIQWEVITDGLWHHGINEKVALDSTLGSGDVLLQFGNGFNGAIPPQGSVINVVYVETLGSSQTLIANNTSVELNTQIEGFVLEGFVTKQKQTSLISSVLTGLKVELSSIKDPICKAYLQGSNTWDKSFNGLQLESVVGGMALITGVDGNVISLSIVSPFISRTLNPGEWNITVPVTGYDEKPASYYQILSPSLGKAENRAVTPADHFAIFLSYPGISDVLVRTEKDFIVRTTIPNVNSAGVTLGPDFVITENPHPAFFNVIWVTVLTQSGTPLTETEKQVLLDWFSAKQLSGTRIRMQDPTVDSVSLNIELRVSAIADATAIKNKAEVLVREMFSTNKPLLSKRIKVSDIYKTLTQGLGTQLDSCEVSKLITHAGALVKAPISDADLSPTLASIDRFGVPTPPGFLKLETLLLSAVVSER